MKYRLISNHFYVYDSKKEAFISFWRKYKGYKTVIKVRSKKHDKF